MVLTKPNQLNILYIAWAFPPMGGNGVQRTLKFVKYLPDQGINLTVLTSTDLKEAGLHDDSLLKEVPECARVVRVTGNSILTPFLRLRDKIKAQDKASDVNKTMKQSFVLSIHFRIRKWIIKRFLMPIWRLILNTLILPDVARSWSKRALRKASSILKKEHIDLIYVTGPPFSAFLLAAHVAQKNKIPLIIEYRDPWVVPSGRPTNLLKKFIEKRWERKILHFSKAVVFNNSIIKNAYIDFFNLPAFKTYVIPNGFDLAQKQGVIPIKEKGVFVFGYTGSFTSQGRSPRHFIDAFYKVLTSQREWRKRVKIKFVGQFWPEDIAYIKSLGLENYIEITGFLPHSESIRHLAGFDVAVVIGEACPGNRNTIPEKIYEYMLFRKPVLAIVPEDGATAELIRSNNIGIVVPLYDVDAIAAGIKILINQSFLYKRVISENLPNMKNFDCRHLTQQLKSVFDKVLSEKGETE